jgi:hypothetical protein
LLNLDQDLDQNFWWPKTNFLNKNFYIFILMPLWRTFQLEERPKKKKTSTSKHGISSVFIFLRFFAFLEPDPWTQINQDSIFRSETVSEMKIVNFFYFFTIKIEKYSCSGASSKFKVISSTVLKDDLSKKNRKITFFAISTRSLLSYIFFISKGTNYDF